MTFPHLKETGFASKAEAEAGTDNAKTMTALRVKEAIEAQEFVHLDRFSEDKIHTFTVGTFSNIGGDQNILIELYGNSTNSPDDHGYWRIKMNRVGNSFADRVSPIVEPVQVIPTRANASPALPVFVRAYFREFPANSNKQQFRVDVEYDKRAGDYSNFLVKVTVEKGIDYAYSGAFFTTAQTTPSGFRRKTARIADNVVDGLSSTSKVAALSAAQGKALNDKLTAIENLLGSRGLVIENYINNASTGDEYIKVCDFDNLPRNGVINIKAVGRGDYDPDENPQGVWEITLRRSNNTAAIRADMYNTVPVAGGNGRKLTDLLVMRDSGSKGTIYVRQLPRGWASYLFTITHDSPTTITYAGTGSDTKPTAGSGQNLDEYKIRKPYPITEMFDDDSATEYVKVFEFTGLGANGLIDLRIIGRGDYDTNEKSQGIWNVIVRHRDDRGDIYLDAINISTVKDGDANRPITAYVVHAGGIGGAVYIKQSSSTFAQYMFTINSTDNVIATYVGTGSNTAPSAGAGETLETKAFHNLVQQ